MRNRWIEATVGAGRRGWLVAVGVTAILLGCDPTVIGPGTVTTVRITPDSIEIAVGDSVIFSAAALDATFALIPRQEITWSSSATSVATVDGEGTVRAVGEGSATISAAAGGASGSADVVVMLPATLALSATSADITARAGAAAPAATTIDVTNAGGFTITNLRVGTVQYADTIGGWLDLTLDTDTAPATLSVALVDGVLTEAGTYTALVPVSSTAASNSPQSVSVTLTLDAGDPDTLALAAGDGQTAEAGTAVPDPVSVQVLDAFGNPVAGVSVRFAVASGGGSVTGRNRTTNASGTATLGSWTLGPMSGANTLTATATGLGGSPLTFTATGVAGSAAAMAPSAGDGQTATVGQAVATAPSVLVTDGNGNPVAGVDVTFAAGAASGTVLPAAAVTTGADGIAAATGWTLGTVAGAQTVSASAAGLTSVTFNATATADVAAEIAVDDGDGQTATVLSAVPIPPSVLVTDQFGNPVPDVDVTFAVTAGGGSVNPTTPVPTGAAGVAAVTSWTLGFAIGANALSATATGGGIAGNPVTFNATGAAGSAGQLALATPPAANAQNGQVLPQAIVIQLQDAGGTDVNQAGVTVTAALTSGAGGVLTGTLSGDTDANGQVAFGNLTITGPVGDYEIGFTATNVSGVLSGTITLTAGAATDIAVNDGDNQVATVNTNLAVAPSVLITDMSGNPVPGVTVTFAASGDGAVTTPMPQSLNDGVATVGSWRLATAAGANTLTATSAGLTGSPVTFNATGNAGAPDAGMSAVVASPTTISAGSETSTITVAVVDQFNNPVEGATVVIASDGTNNTIVQPAAATDAAGQATGTISSTTTEAKTVTATVDGAVTITDDATVTVIGGTPDAGQSTVDIPPGNITASLGGSTAAVTVTVRDAAGNLLSGIAVAVASNGTNNTFNPANGTSSATGVFATDFSSTTAEAKTVTATADGVGITDNAAVTVDPDVASATIATVAQANDSARVGNASAASVTVQDQFLNPISGVQVTFAETNGGGAVGGAVQNTAANGIATVGSWSLDTLSGGVSGDGTFANTLSATASVGATNVNRRAYFSFEFDVWPIFQATAACLGCHGGSGGLSLSPDAATAHGNLFDIDGTCPTPVIKRVDAGSPSTSLLMLRMDGTAVPGCAPGPMPPAGALAAETREIVRSWILHGGFSN